MFIQLACAHCRAAVSLTRKRRAHSKATAVQQHLPKKETCDHKGGYVRPSTRAYATVDETSDLARAKNKVQGVQALLEALGSFGSVQAIIFEQGFRSEG